MGGHLPLQVSGVGDPQRTGAAALQQMASPYALGARAVPSSSKRNRPNATTAHELHTNCRRSAYGFPDDFPQRLVRFQEKSGLSWSEIARRIGTYRHSVWRWKEGRVRPNNRHGKAQLELADSMGLGHMLTGAGMAAVANGWAMRTQLSVRTQGKALKSTKGEKQDDHNEGERLGGQAP